MRDPHAWIGCELLRAPGGDVRFQILPCDALNAAVRVTLEGIVGVRDEEACFGQFEVDIHTLSVPNAAETAWGPKTLTACTVPPTSWVRPIAGSLKKGASCQVVHGIERVNHDIQRGK